MRDGRPSGEWEVFADGFAGIDPIPNTGDAAARPTGLAQGPDGALYASESVNGRIGDAPIAVVASRSGTGS